MTNARKLTFFEWYDKRKKTKETFIGSIINFFISTFTNIIGGIILFFVKNAEYLYNNGSSIWTYFKWFIILLIIYNIVINII